MYHSLFGCPAETTAEGKLEVPKPKRRSVVFTDNAFPYWFDEGMRHDCIWASRSPPLSPKEIERAIKREPSLAGRECVWWANPVHLKSVPEIDHVHVVSRAAPARIAR